MALESEELGQPSLPQRPLPLAVRTYGWKIAGKIRRRLRRQEAPVGAIAVLILAVAAVAVTYLYY